MPFSLIRSTDRLGEERLTERRVTTWARRHRIAKVPGQCGHGPARRAVEAYAALRPFAAGVK